MEEYPLPPPIVRAGSEKVSPVGRLELVAASIVNPAEVTLLKLTLLPAVTSISSLPLPDPPAVNLKFTLEPSATED